MMHLRPQARDIRDLTIKDESGRLVDINILRRAGEMDPESFEPYDDQYNLRKERQTILSNSNFKSSAFGAYYDTLTGNRLFLCTRFADSCSSNSNFRSSGV